MDIETSNDWIERSRLMKIVVSIRHFVDFLNKFGSFIILKII